MVGISPESGLKPLGNVLCEVYHKCNTTLFDSVDLQNLIAKSNERHSLVNNKSNTVKELLCILGYGILEPCIDSFSTYGVIRRIWSNKGELY